MTYRYLQNRWRCLFLHVRSHILRAKLVSVITLQRTVGFPIYSRFLLTFMSSIDLSKQIWKKSAQNTFPFSVPLRKLIHTVWIITQAMYVVYLSKAVILILDIQWLFLSRNIFDTTARSCLAKLKVTAGYYFFAMWRSLHIFSFNP